MFKRESIQNVTGKRCRAIAFCLALFISFKICFAAQTESVTEKNNSRVRKSSSARSTQRYPWKTNIVTTIFWIGEQPGGHNLTPNRTGHHPEAPRVVPWFNEAYQGPAVSTCKDRWIAIRKGNRTAYAQWEDAGPFRTDHWQYVFGNERPKPSLNGGAGLDVSPAIRDYLALKQTDVTDWRFVEFSEVPRGPWSSLGDNNTFVINSRKKTVKVAEREKPTKQGVNTR